jgi:uncharacterized ferritin-like protein (DUF455 family)
MMIEALAALKRTRLAPIVTVEVSGETDVKALLQVALANEINVSELAALWMPTTPEVDVKLALARQAGDEANHFVLVADRLRALGFDPATFAPSETPQFAYLKTLTSTAERLAALWTLESMAIGVNENFMAYCDARGDRETARIYREYIQPDERAHEAACEALLANYATDLAAPRAVIEKLLALAETGRTNAAARFGTACLPGC